MLCRNASASSDVFGFASASVGFGRLKPYSTVAFGFRVGEYLCYGTSWAFGLFDVRGGLYWDEKLVAHRIAPSVESVGCEPCAWGSKKSDVIRSFV